MAAWVPITFALLFPLAITWNSVLTKHMTTAEIGFNPSRVTYFTFAIMNVLILSISIPIWNHYDNF